MKIYLQGIDSLYEPIKKLHSFYEMYETCFIKKIKNFEYVITIFVLIY